MNDFFGFLLMAAMTVVVFWLPAYLIALLNPIQSYPTERFPAVWASALRRLETGARGWPKPKCFNPNQDHPNELQSQDKSLSIPGQEACKSFRVPASHADAGWQVSAHDL